MREEGVGEGGGGGEEGGGAGDEVAEVGCWAWGWLAWVLVGWLVWGGGKVPRKLVSSELSDGVSGNGEGGLEVCDEGGGVGKHERGA